MHRSTGSTLSIGRRSKDFLGVVTTAGIDAVAADPGAPGFERDEPVSDAGQAQKSCGGFRAAETAALATAGESVGIL